VYQFSRFFVVLLSCTDGIRSSCLNGRTEGRVLLLEIGAGTIDMELYQNNAIGIPGYPYGWKSYYQ
jgi:hypothetical protein